jgi:fructokinase
MPGNSIEALRARVDALPPASPRLLVALAGAPASGKSTLGARLAERLGERAALVAMDGFHLDNSVLVARGLQRRKGAPETFDAAGFVAAMRRLAREEEVVLPDFDRARDLSLAGRVVVEARHRIAVVEGNYLLLDRPVWRDLAPLWHLSIYLDVPASVLERRLVRRWLAHGLDPDAAEARARENDLPNAELVRAERLAADVTLAHSA